MAVFPRKETGVIDLSIMMLKGLTDHAELFPSISEEAKGTLATAYSSYNIARIAQAEAQAVAKNATIEKQDKQVGLEEQMHKILYLAEHDCMNNPGALEYIGWSDRKPGTALAKPGQPTGLVPIYEGPGTLTLKWAKAKVGGAVSSYRIERSDQPEGGGVPGPWILINTSFESNITLSGQPRGLEMQYRITATNAAGDSLPSNIATVVL